MQYLSSLLLLLLLLSFSSSCNGNNKNLKNKTAEVKKNESSKTLSNKTKIKYKDTAFLKGELVLNEGTMKQILSKLDIYMSKLDPKQVELIKSLKIENFKSVYFLANSGKIYVKINGLDVLNIIDMIKKHEENKENKVYNKYKGFRYLAKDNITIASDGKNSYIAYGYIRIEKLVNNYNMNINKELNNLIQESKNNGFYVSFIKDLVTKDLIRKFPPFMLSLRGASIFSFNDKKSEKFRILVKLNPKDATEASKTLNLMYQKYLPLILQQLDLYRNLLTNKDKLSQEEKDAYKTLINRIKTMVKSIKIDAKKDELLITMSITTNLEVVVAITGVLAAIAIPAYTGYIQKSKLSSVKLNMEAAERYIKIELSKGETGDKNITDNVLEDLNLGGKKSPFHKGHAAFEKGDKSVSYGSIVISKTNLRNVKSGETVTIYAPKNNKRINFGLKDITITKE